MHRSQRRREMQACEWMWGRGTWIDDFSSFLMKSYCTLSCELHSQEFRSIPLSIECCIFLPFHFSGLPFHQSTTRVYFWKTRPYINAFFFLSWLRFLSWKLLLTEQRNSEKRNEREEKKRLQKQRDKRRVPFFYFLSSLHVLFPNNSPISLRGTLRLPIFMAATICTNISNDDSPPFACVGVTGLLSSRLFLFLISVSHLTLSSESKWCDHITTLLQCDTWEARGTSHEKGRREEEEAVVWWWDSTHQSLTIVVVSSTLRVTVYLLKE